MVSATGKLGIPLRLQQPAYVHPTGLLAGGGFGQTPSWADRELYGGADVKETMRGSDGEPIVESKTDRKQRLLRVPYHPLFRIKRDVGVTAKRQWFMGLTFWQARFWYQFGGDSPMNVNLNTIDFSGVSMSEMKGKLIEVNLDNPFKHMTNVNDALVYGTLSLYQVKENIFRAAHVNQINGRGNYYTFDIKWSSPKAWLFRYKNTIVGGLINSLMLIGGSFMYVGGTPFPIYLHAPVTIKP